MSESKSFSASSAVCNKDNQCKELYEDRSRYDHYRIYNVELATEQHVDLFQKLEKQSDSMIFIGHAREVGQKLSILVAAHKVADLADLLEHYKVKHRILTYNFQEKIDKNYAAVLPIGTDLSKFDWHHYFHLETIYEWLEMLKKKYPNVVTLLDMGNSTQGFPIKGIKISHNPNNKAIFIESGIHAREWIAPATATFIINSLLTSSDETVQNLAKKKDVFILVAVKLKLFTHLVAVVLIGLMVYKRYQLLILLNCVVHLIVRICSFYQPRRYYLQLRKLLLPYRLLLRELLLKVIIISL